MCFATANKDLQERVFKIGEIFPILSQKIFTLFSINFKKISDMRIKKTQLRLNRRFFPAIFGS